MTMSVVETAEIAPPIVYGDQSEIHKWALDVAQVHRVAVSLAQTSFVPASMREKPGEVTAAILAGREVGLSPMTALRSIDIIQGTPAMRAITLRGLVQSAGHEVWVKETTETGAVVEGRRKGSEHVQRSVWTLDRAQKLGLTSKDNWRKQPGAMLVARATSEVCRLIGSDVLMGMPYSVEELDETEVDAAPRRRARRLEPAPEVTAPPLPEDGPPAEDAEAPGPVVEDPPLVDWPDTETEATT